MEFYVTITYRKGGKTKMLSYVGEATAPICDGISLTSSDKVQAIAWVDVISVTISLK